MEDLGRAHSTHLENKEPVHVTWENLTYEVLVDHEETDPETGKQVKSKVFKPLLKKVSGRAVGGRVLAIMGPSGAGKTTFLRALAGRVDVNKSNVLSGAVFLNNTVYDEKYRRIVSFVAQDDIVMSLDTPAEALYFNDRIRTGCSHEEAVDDTQETLRRLNLLKCQDTILGMPGMVKGVSGGERKRTNIGSELICNPVVLLLDEPTTGLDSVNAVNLGELMKELCRTEQRTVICTIHTPSSQLFTCFDDVMLLAKGRVVYHGPREDAPAFFATMGHPVPPRENPSEHFMKVLQLPEDEITRLADGWEKFVSESTQTTNPSIACIPQMLDEHDPALKDHISNTGSGCGLQIALLLKRSLRTYIRNPRSTVGRLIQTLFMSLLIGLFFFDLTKDAQGVQDRLGSMFMCTINSVFLSLMTGPASFPPERAVFLYEQAARSYHPVVYFIAKVLAELPFQLIFPMIYISILYFMVGYVSTAACFFTTMFVIVGIAYCAYALGMFFVAFIPKQEVVFILLPALMLPMMLVGGMFANTERLEPYWYWLNYISIVRYGFKGIVINEFENVGVICANPGPNCPYNTGAEVLVYVGFDGEYWGYQALALWCFSLFYLILAALALTLQGKTQHHKIKFILGDREISPAKGSRS